MQKDFKPGDKVELQHKDTSFYDPETELTLANREQAKLTDPIGRKTRTAILSGRLLVISGGKKPAAAAPAPAVSEPGTLTTGSPAPAPAPKKAPAKKAEEGK